LQRTKIKVLIIRAGGTNRDFDVYACLKGLGVSARIKRINDTELRSDLLSYHALIFPGGFAYGDYVRAGAILGKKVMSTLWDELLKFRKERRPILGICNGFQVLVEASLLPGTLGKNGVPEAALASNSSGRFECRWVTLKKNQASKCIFTKQLKEIARFPVAHGEGRFIMPDARALEKLEENGQIALVYSAPDGTPANGRYPLNPNGSSLDIAGICDPSGTIFGLMPHPENAFFGYQLPDWSFNRKFPLYGDGYGIFESMIEYIETKLLR
jgi:phosphoribosylformylglycinamidine synthase I